MARARHFLREWREFKDYTLEQMAERIPLVSQNRVVREGEGKAITMTHATLSRIERGKLPYNQHLLEVLAEIYQTDVASLLMRDPSQPEGLWSIYEKLTPPAREELVDHAKIILKRRA
jgi:transcriptional regulator with XRE-family HTH domain